MKYGLKYISKLRERNWKTIRLETHDELESLKKLLGPYCLFGVTKSRLSRSNNYKVLLNKSDLLNIVEPMARKEQYKRRNVVTFGIDLMFCNRIGVKVWARYCSKVASDIPDAIHLLTAISIEP